MVLVHVLPAGQGPPTEAQLQGLEQRLDAFFAGSRLCRPGENSWGPGGGSVPPPAKLACDRAGQRANHACMLAAWQG